MLNTDRHQCFFSPKKRIRLVSCLTFALGLTPLVALAQDTQIGGGSGLGIGVPPDSGSTSGTRIVTPPAFGTPSRPFGVDFAVGPGEDQVGRKDITSALSAAKLIDWLTWFLGLLFPSLH